MLEYISGNCEGDSYTVGQVDGASLTAPAPPDNVHPDSNSFQFLQVPAVHMPAGDAVFSNMIHFYAAPGDTVHVNATFGAPTAPGDMACLLHVNGYLVTQ